MAKSKQKRKVTAKKTKVVPLLVGYLAILLSVLWATMLVVGAMNAGFKPTIFVHLLLSLIVFGLGVYLVKKYK